jgi:DNA-binding NarL/FixJ family response regulator
MSIRVLLVDDQALVRGGIRAIVEHEGDLVVVAEAVNGRDAVALARQHQPHVVLMDLHMPVMDGVAATRAICEDPSTSPVVAALTTFDDDESIFSAIEAGASGYLLKTIEPDDLRRAVRALAAGDALLSPTVTTRVLGAIASSRVRLQPETLDPLTEREREILTEVGKGKSNQEIAETLHLSPATTRTYVSRIMQRLGARDRAALVVIAYESGLVTPG